jgi:hypothetical protein
MKRHRDHFSEGCFVQHDEFGLGKVISLAGPNAFVIFQHCGEKIITRSLLQMHSQLVVDPPRKDAVAWATLGCHTESNARLVSFSHGTYRSFKRSGRII